MGKPKMSPAPHGGRVVFCKSFIHYRTKKRVYRKNGGYFRFYLKG